MHIDFTGRHIEVTPALREFAEDKLSKLEKLLDGPLEAHVVLAIEKHRHMAEIQVKSRTTILSGMVETGDLYASIGEVVDKLERQALKHKEKLQSHKHRKGPRDPEVAAEIAARADVPEDGDTEAGPERIRRSQSYRLKPLSAEDAALEIESSTEDVIVYRDAQSDRICVLYRHRDGDLRLIEPEF
jgi:putative sigma-54 modulation protein